MRAIDLIGVLMGGLVLCVGCRSVRQPHYSLTTRTEIAQVKEVPAAPTVEPAQPAAAFSPFRSSVPPTIDLRPMFTAMSLPPRPQGARGTCSIFTTCEAIEFANAKATGVATRLSPEFVNWAGWNAAGSPSDGNFFHNALAGYAKFGVCAEASMAYQQSFDAGRAPSAEALAEAAQRRDSLRDRVVVRWIVPWKPDRFGVNPEQFAEIKRVLASGFPVAAGSGHSRLLVGYRDDEGQPSGGVFFTEDSALNRFDEVTYQFVREQVADVFWVDAVPPSRQE